MANIVSQKRLRTGDLDFSATTATDVDQYLVRVDERITKTDMAELFIDENPTLIPRASLKQLGSNYLICDRIRCSPHSGYLWHIDVHWKEIDAGGQLPLVSYPTPTGNSLNPVDWSPTYSRRTQVIHEPARELFYKGGYATGASGSKVGEFFEGFAPDRAPVLNSAMQPFTGVPERRRLIQIWTFRWLRTAIAQDTLDAENKINASAWTISPPGLPAQTFASETALIDSLDISIRKDGTNKLVELAATIIVDPDGWRIRLRDQGTSERTFEYVDNAWQSSLTQIENSGGMPVLLDGNGKQLGAEDDPAHSEWLDNEVVDFDTVPLIKDL